ncbi:RING finger and SPRY domain-containing protein 1-like [Dendronephthya gigantea]|uniref:RING finger and SPRY domain-containing protein 1-like n=1 Tax=Dendronephthya gigantea TaxID=151771 RepID=UPI00106A7667|nr:RING finger and SPRY domain-containing protein 1-like [Dendronephthya gigantea]
MGCCRSKHDCNETAIEIGNSLKTSRTSSKESRNVVKFDEEDIRQPTVSEWPPNDHENRSNVQNLVLDVLDVVRKLTESIEEPPPCLKKLHEIAEKESGWLDMVMACVKMIPIGNDLGPAVISILLDECSLAPKPTLYKLLCYFGLTSERIQNSPEIQLSNSEVQRNMAIVLGSLAEKLAGPQSAWLMREEVLQFLLSKLRIKEHPSVVLFSIITLEKFAKTNENKEKIRSTNISERLAEFESTWLNSHNVIEHQAGFCAQWCLDNSFPLKDRPYSYENMNLDGINAMLNVNDVSTYLKISPQGLEARSDAFSFESVRSTFSVSSGTWYYEVILLTSGVMQIGWATKESRFLSHEGYGIGDDINSIAFDGCRQLIWFDAESFPISCTKWKPDDVLGLLLNIDENKVIFYLNGAAIERYFPAKDRGAFFAAASFMSFQHCKFNFGADPFRYPPNVPFRKFNDHSKLSDEEKKILPRRHVQMAELKDEKFHADSCTICYEHTADAVLLPCEHRTICYKCATKLEQCPICRCGIEDIAKQIVSMV